MSAYVEECRQEWRRLGVPDLLADEMAADLEADLAEAQAEGVAAEEILGESDPRRFAAAWASERGLVSEQPPKPKSRKRFWIVLAVGLVVLGFFLGIADVAFLTKPKVSFTRGPAVEVSRPLVVVPPLVGLQLCHALRIARTQGFHVGRQRGCKRKLVVHQRPTAGALVPGHSSMTLRSALARTAGTR